MTVEKDMLLQQIRTYAQKDTVLAFSGGVDSALLLCLLSQASRETGRRVYAVTFHTVLHPQADLACARQLADTMDISHHILTIDELEDPRVSENPPDRCYHCKKMLFERLWRFARERHVDTVLEGSNRDDLGVYRPGLKAVQELGVASPLAQCGITKAQVRQMAAAYGLPVASRPSVPCLATRIPTGTAITRDLLARVARGEAALMARGFSDFRLRLRGDGALLQVREEQMDMAREALPALGELLREDFASITLDSAPRYARET